MLEDLAHPVKDDRKSRRQEIFGLFERDPTPLVVFRAAERMRNGQADLFLSGFGYKGVPLNVFYPAHGEPVVLPQLLTEDIVISTITKGD